MPVIVPPWDIPVGHYAEIIYLLGPDEGAPNWQEEAVLSILAVCKYATIANPRTQPIPSETATEWSLKNSRRWSDYHLDAAQRNGIVLCWFPAESEHLCSRSYAQSSWISLGRCVERFFRTPFRIAIGVQESDPGSERLRFLMREYFPGVTVYSTLAETCRLATAMIQGKMNILTR